MKKILKIILPSLLTIMLIFLWRDDKDILNGIFIAFPSYVYCTWNNKF